MRRLIEDICRELNKQEESFRELHHHVALRNRLSNVEDFDLSKSEMAKLTRLIRRYHNNLKQFEKLWDNNSREFSADLKMEVQEKIESLKILLDDIVNLESKRDYL